MPPTSTEVGLLGGDLDLDQRAVGRGVRGALDPDVVPAASRRRRRRRALARRSRAPARSTAATVSDAGLGRRDAGREPPRCCVEREREAARRRADPVESPVAVALGDAAAERGGVDAVRVQRREQAQQTTGRAERAHRRRQLLGREVAAREDPAQVGGVRAGRGGRDQRVGVGEDPGEPLARRHHLAHEVVAVARGEHVDRTQVAEAEHRRDQRRQRGRPVRRSGPATPPTSACSAVTYGAGAYGSVRSGRGRMPSHASSTTIASTPSTAARHPAARPRARRAPPRGAGSSASPASSASAA